ncbi:hypothetical protein AB0N02_42270, partial [Streptosporangium sp. NPDC051022]
MTCASRGDAPAGAELSGAGSGEPSARLPTGATAGAATEVTEDVSDMAGTVGNAARDAVRDAERVAGAAGVRIAELSGIGDFEGVRRLFDDIWQSDPGNAPISVELMRALSHAGNYVAGAYDGERLVGASVAFLAAPVGRALHSHVTGAAAGRGAGLALKLHQRAWALERGLDRITWTYDPLVRRNAHFNLVKLGARPVE